MGATLTTSAPALTWLEKFLEKKAILTLLPNLELYQWGREAIVPNAAGKEVYAPYFFDRSAAAGTVAESATFANSAMSGANYSSTLAEYAKSFEFGRFLWSTKSVPLLAETTRQLMMATAKGWESTIQGVISGGAAMSAASFVAGDSSTAYASVVEGTQLKARALSVASKILAAKYVPGFDNLGGQYAGVFHPNALHHLRTNLSGGTTITPVADSMNMTSMFRGRLKGDLFSVRLYESAWSAKFVHATNGLSASNSGHLNYVIGPEAYFVSPLANGRPEVILHGFGSGGTSDPANRKSTLATYSVFTAFAGPRATRMVQVTTGVNS